MSIIRELEKGLKESGTLSYTVEADRAEAISLAMGQARRGDIVVIAGKGHEDYQIIGRTKIHFSDREEVEKHLNMKGEAS
jgi:UDP-N-acetylmuramoyl-L-alanyl-D-glutamate--2,6-diaminopimelate ligase